MKQLLASVFCGCFFIAHAQFKADNVTYKTVFPEDLCKTLQANPGYVLLDVRSDGEFNDTLSGSPALNIGHMQNALHINITQLPQRWKELLAYKDRPLFIYCSHSQRSRRASRLLADSGFSHVYNINGGLTEFYAEGLETAPCSGYTIVRSTAYKIISPKQLAENMKKGDAYYIIDLRTDSVFNGKAANEPARMQGRFDAAVNMPFSRWKESDLSALPKKPILLIDESGAQSPLAAKMLIDKGFGDVSILFNGMDEWLRYAINNAVDPALGWTRFSNYNMVSADELANWMKEGKKIRLVDIRPQDQFGSSSKNYWQNVGQIKNAVNIPYSELASMSLPPGDGMPVVVYGFNSEDDVFNAARAYRNAGYANVYVLQGGIWNMRWASHNLKNKMYLNDWVVNVPPENQ